MKEIWKEIKGYEDKYLISNLGNVKSLNYNNTKFEKERLLDDKNGYKRVALLKNSKGKKFFVHRLVAEAFIPNPNNYPIVNHKDGNPSNNNIDNLEWCTIKYNTHHALETGLIKMKKIKKFDIKGKYIKTYNNIWEIKKELKNICHIYDCCRGERKTAYGFVWKYEE